MGKNKPDEVSKASIQSHIQTQNIDTGLPVFRTSDISSFERKNMPKGSSNKNRGSK